MRSAILILLIIISVSLIILVLMQQGGSGAGSIFGGGGGGEVYRTRRGIEKILHYLTIVLAFAFSAVSISLIFIK